MMKIGCIGQGFVGKNIADEFEERSYPVVRYSLESEHIKNKDELKNCEVVFIGVPTPTTPGGFDYSIIEEVLKFASDGATAVIKSTVLPGTTAKLQKKYPNKIILFSPEFLCESTAAHDVRNPILNVIGVDQRNADHEEQAKKVMEILPKCKANHVVSREAAELFKYAHNINGYMRVMLTNMLFDLGQKFSVDWEEVEEIMNQDPMMSPYYNKAVHKDGRGAGGNCFVKDMAAFRHIYEEILSKDKKAIALLKSLEEKNLELLKNSGKSLEIVKGVYGDQT